MILDEDWEVLGYGEDNTRRQAEGIADEVEIHGLFKYSLSRRSKPNWSNCSYAKYKEYEALLKPSFKLATMFLTCPASLDWFYYLVYTRRVPTNPPLWHNGAVVQEYRRDDLPMEERHQQAKIALKRLATFHTIQIEDLDLDDEGATRPDVESFPEGINIKDRGLIKSGLAPRIVISRDFVDELRKMKYDGSQSSFRSNNLRVKLAATLVHEIAVSLAL